MKTFDTFMADIGLMTGKRLESLRPGAELDLLEVSAAAKQVIVRGVDGKTVRRTFKEFEQIWSALAKSGMVHVDTVLKGSGSRRNQPETIVASLPYIEWGKVERRKHLFLVESRRAGEPKPKPIDPFLQRQIVLRQTASKSDSELPSFVIVTASIVSFCTAFGTRGKCRPVSPNLYELCLGTTVGWVCHRSLFPSIELGTYILLGSKSPPEPGCLILASLGDVQCLEPSSS